MEHEGNVNTAVAEDIGNDERDAPATTERQKQDQEQEPAGSIHRMSS